MFVWAFKSPLKCSHHKYLMDNLLLIVSSVLLLACKDKWISTLLLPPAPHIHSLPAPSPEQPAECYLFILWISPTHINCHSNINSSDESHYHKKFNPSFVRACKWAVLLLKIQFLWLQLQLAYVSDNGDSRKRGHFSSTYPWPMILKTSLSIVPLLVTSAAKSREIKRSTFQSDDG